jgi:hypothetical protein
MHNVMGVIDGIHICITNPIGGFWEDYYWHKTKGYNIVTRAMLTTKKGS